nr:isoform 2 of snw/ski-interacting protein [Quercus suber]
MISLAVDGRGLQDVQIDDHFGELSEALYVTEQKAQEVVVMRSMIQKELMMKEKESKERELRALARKACSKRTGVAPPTAAMDSSDMIIDDEHEREDEKDNLPKETMEEKGRTYAA